MHWCTAALREAKVKAAFLLAGLIGCLPASGLDLHAAMAKADARGYAACGLRAHPSSVRLVDGYIHCGSVRAVGCTWMQDGSVRLSRVIRTQADLERVTVHEYLHLLGATHVPAGQGIMGVDRESQLPRVTAADLAPVACRWVRAER